MIVCNTTPASNKIIIVMVVFIISYIFCPLTVFAQEKQDYWIITIKRSKYKILPQNKIDTITIPSNSYNQNLCITHNTANANKNSNNLILIMTNNRQVITKSLLKNGMVVFPMAMFDTVTDKIVSINVVQQPITSAFSRTARIGTKLICYVKW